MASLIHKRTHPEYREGCFACKISTISVGVVPGTDSPRSKEKTHNRHVERNLNKYKAKRDSGERPDGTSKEAMDKYEKKVDLWERRETDIRDNNSPEQVDKIRKSLVNQ